jgi:UDP-N-acetylmuramoyl-L-alanyl-D-glutamate--2,6-diaminopimelate ligase
MTERLAPIGLSALLDGLTVNGALPQIEVRSLVLNARETRPGDVFVAVQGHARHGLEFIGQAVERGASAVLHDGMISQLPEANLPLIEVGDLQAALPILAQRRWGDPSEALDLVAVTGTNGKTSVAWLLAQALDGAMIGTLGIGRPGGHAPGTMTTPDVFSVYRQLHQLAEQGFRSVVLEASSHALDQRRLAGLRFTSVIFTTLGHDHLDYHADREAYGRAKARLFRDYESERQIINLDDAFGQVLAAELEQGAGLITLAIRSDLDADLRGTLIEADRQGLRARLQWPARARDYEVQAPLLGQINLYNLMILAAELAARGRSRRDIQDTLARLMPVPGRMQPLSDGDSALAVVDYAHTPDALEAALKSLQVLEPAQLWCVFGCGGNRDATKRPIMGRIAESLADKVVLTNDNPRDEDPVAIVRAIQGGMRQPQRAAVRLDRAEAIRYALDHADREDVILIAGKGHETEQVIGDGIHAFSDVETVEQWLGEAR